jgi:hypothetical protein
MKTAAMADVARVIACFVPPAEFSMHIEHGARTFPRMLACDRFRRIR